jgi:PEP-CTERM motif
MSRGWLGAIAVVFAGNVEAALIATSQVLDFEAGKQSLWGPSGLAASFHAEGGVGNSTLGFNYAAQASTGTVEDASFAGLLNYVYEDSPLLGDASVVQFNFTGGGGGGLFDTLFGLSLTTEYRILGGEGCIYCRGAALDINKSFTPALDTSFSGSDTATPATADVGPNIGVAEATAGVDIDVKQTSTLRGNGISGQVTAVNRDTGDTRALALDIADNGVFGVDLGLDVAGLWDVTLSSLTLDNSFFSAFWVSFVPFVQYTIGLGCGDPGTNSDNGLLCGGDGRAAWNLPNIPLGSTDTFALTFNQLNLRPFTIDVLDSTAPVQVPEPSSLLLLAGGLCALCLVRRRQRVV